MPITSPVLLIDVGHVAEACVICIRGELDIAGCPAVERALKDAEASQAQRLIIDLEQLEFIDSAGLHALLHASQRSARNGNRLQITTGTGHVARMIALTGFDKVLPLIDPCLAPALSLDRTGNAISRGSNSALDQQADLFEESTVHGFPGTQNPVHTTVRLVGSPHPTRREIPTR